MTTVHFVVPDGIDDPARPSGGNVYDRRVSRGLTSLGWSVHEHPVPGFRSSPDAASFAALDDVVGRIPDDSTVLLDGLVASTAPEVLLPQARRLRLLVLVHMPLGQGPSWSRDDHARERQCAVLSAVAGVIATSAWSRRRLSELCSLSAGRVHVAEPGVAASDLAEGTPAGTALLCVAAVTPQKGHDVLFDALATVTDLSWRCQCVGSLDLAPEFVEDLGRRARDAGLTDRVGFAGPLSGADLERAYAASDLLVLPSRGEAYGMVVTEALARGLPVVATDVGGVKEALGHGADGVRPGLLVPADDSAALGAALRSWLGDAELRLRLRRAARERRESLSEWATTASAIASVVAGVSR